MTSDESLNTKDYCDFRRESSSLIYLYTVKEPSMGLNFPTLIYPYVLPYKF